MRKNRFEIVGETQRKDHPIGWSFTLAFFFRFVSARVSRDGQPTRWGGLTGMFPFCGANAEATHPQGKLLAVSREAVSAVSREAVSAVSREAVSAVYTGCRWFAVQRTAALQGSQEKSKSKGYIRSRWDAVWERMFGHPSISC